MIERFLPARVAEFYERDLPEPVHVPNLITFADRDSYRRYATAVYPLIKLLGGGMRWMGEHEAAYVGDPQAEEFLVVEYPNHRRFLLMTVNPFYYLINRWREQGVDYFEAAFSYSPQHDASLGRHERLLVVHLSDRGADGGGDPETNGDIVDRVRSAFAGADAEFVYASRQVAPFEWLGEPRKGSDPHPLTYERLVCFAVPDREAADAAADAATEDLDATGRDYALQLYRRSDGI